ncbi:hypothetical protein [Streptomyces malaysiense]|uniref:Tetratricopeptide repeat protein n=1 Tax=Streptomyces malaysiense TaxID=1428626 RepID=A0A1J4Q688_9ACTN|nr:hypothetical protein [Streptomyces malaysiense]OIK28677.1 hypothetical protein VT52_004800 [Streptomyces malaysiense]
MPPGARKLQKIADRESKAAIRYLQGGHPERALASSAKALEAVRQLRQAEPDEVDHTLALASVLYNHAAFLAASGDAGEGVQAAQASLALYESLLPHGYAERVAVLVRRASRQAATHPQGPGPLEVAMWAADVKVRLCRLLAEAEGPGALAEIHRLGGAAMALYEQIAGVLPQLGEELERVEEEYRRVLDFLGEPA